LHDDAKEMNTLILMTARSSWSAGFRLPTSDYMIHLNANFCMCFANIKWWWWWM